MQPSHAIGDLHFAPSRLGPSRLDRGYAWRRFLDAGCIIAGGSDAPVERGDPRIEFYAAVARRDLKGFRGEGWHPEQAVSRMEALRMLTEWPAYAAFEEKRRGTLEAGKWADMTVFDRDLLRCPEGEIPLAKLLFTIVNGRIVHQSKS
jgi:predicted amidohydrolase YtcJ